MAAEKELSRRMLNGARAKVFVENKEVGRCTGVTWRYNIQTQRFDPMGEAVSTAIVINGATVTVNISRGMVTDTDLVAERLVPACKTEALLDWPEMTFVLYDRVTNKPQYEIRGCMPQGAGGSIQGRALAMNDVSYEGRIFAFGSELSNP